MGVEPQYGQQKGEMDTWQVNVTCNPDRWIYVTYWQNNNIYYFNILK